VVDQLLPCCGRAAVSLPNTVSFVGPDVPLENVSVGIVSGHKKAGEWSSTSTSWYAWEIASLSLLVGE